MLLTFAAPYVSYARCVGNVRNASGDAGGIVRASERLSVRNRVQEGGAAALPEHTGHAFEVSAHPKQPHDQRRMSDQVTSSDDAAHSVCFRNKASVSTSRANPITAS